MRETVTIQVGQCGNQIGNQFWTTLLQEHEKTKDSDEALSAFFRFTPERRGGSSLVMKARALLIDMECGPLQETMRSPLGSLFDEAQFVMDVYGSGNNFAHGHYLYGPQYRDRFEEGLRRNAEQCDSLQTFIVTHSLGGGTGSGVGSYLISLLDELYPEIYRFSACVFPSEENNDVVTSPYNSVLATRQLIEHADCVLPIDNQALLEFAKLETKKKLGVSDVTAGSTTGKTDRATKSGFNEMNAVAARMLCHLTSSSRFHGDMNVDMNEICTNLVPYPRLHFLMTALSPRRAVAGGAASGSALTGRSAVQRAFSDILSRTGQITAADPSASGSITIASAFLARGPVPLSDFLGCVTTAQTRSMVFPSWNQNACKIGMCAMPAPNETMSIMGVYNNTSFSHVLSREKSRFNLLFKRKAMLHHYTEFVDVGEIETAECVCSTTIGEYREIESAGPHGLSGDGEKRAGTFGNNRLRDTQLFPAF